MNERGKTNDCHVNTGTVRLLDILSVCLFLLQIYVDELVTYLKTLANDWIGHAAYDTAYGAFLAVNVVKTFMGENYAGYTIDHDGNKDPLWLRLKWGVAIASRALDVWTSCRHGIDDTSVKRRCAIRITIFGSTMFE